MITDAIKAADALLRAVPYCRAAALSKTTGKRSNWWNICWKTMNTIR